MSDSVMRLSDLCDFTPESVDPSSSGDGIYVGLEHLDSGRVMLSGQASATAAESSKWAFRRGDVLYGKLRPYLDKAAVAGVDGICSTELLVLRPKPGIDSRFLAAVAHAPQFIEHALSDTVGKQYPRTSWNHLKNFTLPRFDEGDQLAIAKLSWSIQGALRSNDLAEQTSAALRRSAMHALFTRGLRSEPQKESEIGPIPESWEVVAFATVRERLQYGTSARCTLAPVGVPVLRIPNVQPGRVLSADLKYADLPSTEVHKYRLVDGDLLFIRTNGVVERLGACAVYTGEPETALFASYLIRAQVLKDRVLPQFVSYFLGSEGGTTIIAGRATPAADGKYNLNTGTIDGLPIPLPGSLDEQREIVEILDAIDRKIDLHRRKRAILEDLFKSLLHKLLTGEISVADLDLSTLEAQSVAPEPAGL